MSVGCAIAMYRKTVPSAAALTDQQVVDTMAESPRVTFADGLVWLHEEAREC